jgi:hypothetical protein
MSTGYTALFIVACLLGLVACAGWVLAYRKSLWRTVKVDNTGRGPNADCSYRVPPSDNDGQEAWFTVEAVETAKARPSTLAKRALKK